MASLAPFNCIEPSRWESWKRSFEYYIAATDITTESRKIAVLMHVGGRELQDVYHAVVDADVKAETLKEVLDVLDKQFLPKKNVTYERHVFRKESQKPGETVDVFATRLRGLVKTCEYGPLQDEMIRDQIVDKCLSHRLRCSLLRENDLTLASALNIARSMEDADRQAEQMEEHVPEGHAVCATTTSRPARRTPTWTAAAASDRPDGREKCSRCGRGGHDSDSCFAKTKRCHGCGRMGHFQRACRDGRPRAGQHVRLVTAEPHEDHVFRLAAADHDGTYSVQVSGQSCDLLVDSGATCNVMSETLFRDMFATKRLLPNRDKLYAYGSGKPMSVIGQFQARVTFQDSTIDAVFHVIPGSHQSLLGKEASEKLGLLRVGPQVRCVSSKGHPANKYPSLFRGLGKLKDFQLKVPIDSGVTPVAQKVRKIPFSLQEPVERKLSELLAQDIIEKVSGPTPWVSPVVCAPKKNGDIRLCVDMRRANAAVIRERHPMPTLDDVLHEMNGANVFSKLDLAQSFHQIELEESSRSITTFVTHKGLYRYKRLMFGISCAPEMHQRVIQQVLEGCEGARNIADDIIVYASTTEQHDQRLDEVLRRLQEAGLKLNGSKCQFGMTELTFMGHRLSRAGVTASDEKVAAVINAREPRNASEVRSFLGLVTFLGRFLPDLSTVSAPLRDLTKSGVPWKWEKAEKDSFTELKQRLSDKNVLAYFSPSAETQLVVDASPVGLGAVLLQRQRTGVLQPVEFASRSLSDVERRYSQTEREALAVVWGCERFHLYLYGIDFELITDHKALQSIFSPTSRPPARIKRWVLRLQPYSYRIKHISGPRNIADCFSRLTQTTAAPATDGGEHYARFVALHAVPTALEESDIQRETAKDEELQLIVTSLPAGKKHDCPRAYRTVWAELSVANGMLLRGSRLVVPQALRRRVLDLAHEGHQGIVRTKEKLRSGVWWPGVDVDAERLVRSCHACQVVSSGSPPEPVSSTELPAGPWQDLNVDLCGPFPDGQSLLVLVDQYSKWVEVETLTSTTTQEITSVLEKIFARHGFPFTLTTDNAQNLCSAHFKDFCKVRGIKHLTVTPLWPQANGQVERQNRTLLKAIRTAVAEGRNWPSSLQTFLLAYRTTPHPATGTSPAELLCGRQLRTKMPTAAGPELAPGRPAVEQWNRRYREAGARYADHRRHARPSDVVVGDRVLVRMPKRQSKLSAAYFADPYIVVGKNGSQLTVRRRDGRVYKRNSSFVKRYVDFTEPLTAASQSVQTDAPLARPVGADGDCESTEIRTRSGRLINKPKWYGEVVSH